MRIAIVADNVSTRFGGESLNALHYFQILLSRGVDAQLIVHGRNAEELKQIFPNDLNRIHFVPDTRVHRLLFAIEKRLPTRAGSVTLGLLAQLYTQLLQRRIIRKLVDSGKVDVVHQPVPVAPRYPSMIYGLGAPVILGPLNGDMAFPPAFRSRQGRFEDMTVSLSRRVSNICNRILPGKLHAQTILVANERTRKALPAGVSGNVIEVLDNAVDFSVWQRPAAVEEKTSDQPVRFVYLGRLVNWKAVDLLLQAFQPVAAQSTAVLQLIGDGCLRGQLTELAQKLGIADRVIFAGWMSQQQCAAELAKADVLVLPSLLECGGAVVLEAMACGLPVIATRWGGPADYLDETCGILVDPDSHESFAKGLSDAMLKLERAPELRHSMGRAGIERVHQHFDWERKLDQIVQIYHQTRDSNSTGEKSLRGNSSATVAT